MPCAPGWCDPAFTCAPCLVDRRACFLYFAGGRQPDHCALDVRRGLKVANGDRRFVNLACINIVIAANAGGAFSPFGDITTLMVWQAGKVQFGQFFTLLIPSLLNFLVPAILMS